jgi:hypothetical protein
MAILELAIVNDGERICIQVPPWFLKPPLGIQLNFPAPGVLHVIRGDGKRLTFRRPGAKL